MKRAAFAIASLVLLMAPATSRAEDKKIEAAARAAIELAHKYHSAAAFDKATVVLQKTLRACAANKCTTATVAAVERDLGVMQLHEGDADSSTASFVEALKIEPQSEPNPIYDAPEVRDAWTAAKEELAIANAVQPTGDFVHTPAAEQVVGTAVPVYLEHLGTTPPSKVILKYKATGMTAFAQVTLARMGRGWGGLVPCDKIVRGVVRYYVVGLDAEGTPTASSGDPKQPYFVRIKPGITASPPSLPGVPPPPPGCSDVPKAATTAAPAPEGNVLEQARAEPENRAFARWWIGVSGSIDLFVLPSNPDVCKLSGGAPLNTSGYYCTDPYGNDYPSRQASADNDALIPGKAGQTSGGPVAGTVRAMVAVDYAVTEKVLIGARAGVVANRYPGQAASHDGKVVALPPIHLELRGMYVFGDAPLAHAGLAPYAFAAGGISEFDASTTVRVSQTGIVGQRAMLAWVSGGPAFAAIGGGGRYALSARAAFSAGLKVTGAIGPGGFLPTIGPEIALQYGF